MRCNYFQTIRAFPVALCLTAIIPLLSASARAQYTETVLYSFSQTAGNSGYYPLSNLVFDAQGNLYGTTYAGGLYSSACVVDGDNPVGCGTVFELSPPPSGSTSWNYMAIYEFCSRTNCADGRSPLLGDLTFDSKGNLYGTTPYGGNANDAGVVFELSPPASGSGPWTETVLYRFCSVSGCSDGGNPSGGVIFDSKGNLYGTAGGGNGGVVFELTPPSNSSSIWTESVLYRFCPVSGCSDGEGPFDRSDFRHQGQPLRHDGFGR